MVTLEDAVIARLDSHGHHFEVYVDPELGRRIRQGEDVDVEDALAVQEIFEDAKQADRASEDAIREVFETTDPLEVAEKILRDGEIQLTTEQRREMVEEKHKQIVNNIARNAVNPQQKTPHPPDRIENALEEADFRADPFKPVEIQVQQAVDAIRHLIPISLEKVRISVTLPADQTGPGYGVVRNFGTLVEEEWLSDGSWTGVVEMPAGSQEDFFNQLNQKTEGHVDTKIIK